MLVESAHAITREYPGLEVHAVVGDFERHLASLPADARRLFAFLGSTIGSLGVEAREKFLRAIATSLGEGDTLLLGIDLVKDATRLQAAYADSSGLSETFQRNGLANLDRNLGSRFSEGRFEHYAIWDDEHEWVEIGFHSVGAQVLAIPGLDLEVAFADGEALRTSVSAKFRRERFSAELTAAGLELAALVVGCERRLRRLPRGVGTLLAARLPPLLAPDVTLRLGEHLAEDPHDLVELRLAGDEGRGDLDHGIAAIVGAADQARIEQRVREEAAHEAARTPPP